MGLYNLYIQAKTNGLIDFIGQKPWSYIEFLVKEGSPEIEKYLPETLDILEETLPENLVPQSDTAKKLYFVRLISHPFAPEVFKENPQNSRLDNLKKKAIFRFAVRGM